MKYLSSPSGFWCRWPLWSSILVDTYPFRMLTIILVIIILSVANRNNSSKIFPKQVHIFHSHEVLLLRGPLFPLTLRCVVVCSQEYRY